MIDYSIFCLCLTFISCLLVNMKKVNSRYVWNCGFFSKISIIYAEQFHSFSRVRLSEFNKISPALSPRVHFGRSPNIRGHFGSAKQWLEFRVIQLKVPTKHQNEQYRLVRRAEAHFLSWGLQRFVIFIATDCTFWSIVFGGVGCCSPSSGQTRKSAFLENLLSERGRILRISFPCLDMFALQTTTCERYNKGGFRDVNNVYGIRLL